MTKYQFILLVLLISFVTALVTGVVSVALVNQAPPPITQTIQKVVERTVETIQKPLEVDEARELEASALARDILVGDIANRVTLSVVGITSKKGSMGSGFLVSEDGFLITNRRIVEDETAEYSVVLNNGEKFAAEVLARDPLLDIAILKISPEEGKQFAFIRMGNSDTAKAGHTAIVVGNVPEELRNTVSVGVISALRSYETAFGTPPDQEGTFTVIQIDTAITGIISGGPLLNLKGEAIGLSIATSKTGANEGFAVPINLIKASLEAARENGKITYPSLGIRYALITPELKLEKKLVVDYGALVTAGPVGEPAVATVSAANKAGIKEGDIILEFGGIKVTPENDLGKLILQKKAGDKVKIKVLRTGTELELEALLGER